MHGPVEHPDVKTMPVPDLRLVLDGSLEKRWRRFQKELKRCQKKFSEKSVHDLRVSIRRLLSLLEILVRVVPHPSGRTMRRELRRHLRAFGPLRDTQVQLLLAEPLLVDHPELAPFCTTLKVRERRLIKQLDRHIHKMNLDRLASSVRMLHGHIRSCFETPGMRNAVEVAVVGTAARTFARVGQRHAAIEPSKLATIHRLRIAFKRFRYMMEVLQPFLPGVTNERLKAMHDYQVRMGDIQDMEVMLAHLRRFGARRRLASPRSLAAVRRKFEQRRTERVQAFLASADEVMTFWKEISPVSRNGNGELKQSAHQPSEDR